MGTGTAGGWGCQGSGKWDVCVCSLEGEAGDQELVLGVSEHHSQEAEVRELVPQGQVLG